MDTARSIKSRILFLAKRYYFLGQLADPCLFSEQPWWKHQDKSFTGCQCGRCTHDVFEERLSEVRTHSLYSASQSYLHTVCTCRENAVEFCTVLSLIMPPLAFHSRLSFTSPFNLLISCNVFHHQIQTRRRRSGQWCTSILCSRYNQLYPCCSCCSSTILGKKIDEHQTLGR